MCALLDAQLDYTELDVSFSDSAGAIALRIPHFGVSLQDGELQTRWMDTPTGNLHVLVADRLPVLLRTPEDLQVAHHVKLYAGGMIDGAQTITSHKHHITVTLITSWKK